MKEVESSLEAVYQLKQESSQVNSSVPEDLGALRNMPDPMGSIHQKWGSFCWASHPSTTSGHAGGTSKPLSAESLIMHHSYAPQQ